MWLCLLPWDLFGFRLSVDGLADLRSEHGFRTERLSFHTPTEDTLKILNKALTGSNDLSSLSSFSHLKYFYGQPFDCSSALRESLKVSLQQMADGADQLNGQSLNQLGGSLAVGQLTMVISLQATKEPIGMMAIQLLKDYSAANLMLFIQKRYASQGYGAEAVPWVIDFLRQNTDISELMWVVHPENVAAKKLGEKFFGLSSQPFCLLPGLQVSFLKL